MFRPKFYAILGEHHRGAFDFGYVYRSRFPRETSGFLYYKPSTTSVLLDGQIRFRVTKSSGTFNEGSDLLKPDGSVWKLGISRVLGHKRHVALADLLLKENPSLKTIPPQTILAHLHRIVRTLNPQHITASDFHDISGILAPSYNFERSDSSSEHSYIVYESAKKKPLPFPPKTRGFLYHLPPSEGMAEGQIRFRLTDDFNPSSFVGGRDLTFSTGLPWHIPLHLLHDSMKSGILCFLSEETTLPTEDDANFDTQLLRKRTSNPMITEFGQLFSLDFSKTTYVLWVKIGRHRFEDVRISNPLISYENLHSPYDGVALCCFEPSPRSKGRKRGKAVLRLVKIIKPFTRKEHVKRSSTPMATEKEAAEPPEEGQLFMFQGRERAYFLRGSLSEASGSVTRS
ncbi:hypothetical protein EW146_g9068 [Bondarzewia mesenterica]|uniref:Uncharacterized protein n=1 Tax=Bondarzewia mesenterica TaxID=1095465 RepID=A0A4S4L9T4_9AGAM|nr:hypothetical protein EW146_g9068 [Bondarzewia mesenterica]